MVHGDAIKLFALLGLLALSMVPTGWAGTVEDPEVVDPAGDASPATSQIGNRDLVKMWVTSDGTNLTFHAQLAAEIQQLSAFYAGHERIRMAFVPTGGLPAGAVEAYVNIRLGFIQQGAPAETVACSFGTATAVGGSRGVSQEVAGVAAFSGASYNCTINGATVLPGFDIASGSLTKLYAQLQLVQRGPVSGTIPDDPAGVNVLTTYDRAPNTGFGRDYGPISGAGVPANATNNTMLDEDLDGLNDTWETQHFGNITLQNGTGDPDADGLNNTAEFEAGTDPTKADTDGDDVPDGQDEAPLDPTKPPLTNTTDRDNDTLPDLWERQYFNNTAAQNATGDPDNDTLNNSREHELGTDPTKSDTDADGVNDAADAFPLDQARTTNEPADSPLGRRVELYSGALMFAAAATLCLLGLARP